MLATVLVLILTKTVGPWTALCMLLMTLLLLVTFTIVSMSEEMRASAAKPRSAFLSGLYSYLLPFAFFGAAFLGWFVMENIWLGYLVGGLLLLALSAPPVARFLYKIDDLFLDLEMVN